MLLTAKPCYNLGIDIWEACLPRLRLAILDVDGTLKQAESPYQYLHEKLGVSALAAEHRELALARRISYAEWLYRDVRLWAGVPAARLRELLAANPYVPGAPELLRELKLAGVTVALVSAGFTLNTDPLVAEFGLDFALANELNVGSDGCLDGTAVTRVAEGSKAACARDLIARLDVPVEQVVAAGDTSGDLELFDCARLRLAVNPRSEALRARAHVVFEPDLTGAAGWLRERGYI